MKTYRVRITETARADLERIAVDIAAQSPQNARFFVSRAVEAFESIARCPSAVRLALPDLPSCDDVRRGLIARQPNHLYYFFIDDGSVVVFRVVDGRRDDLSLLARKP